jgi:Amidohydrolase
MGVEAAFAWLTDTPMPPAGWAWPHKSRHGGRWRARVRARSREHWERLRKETPRAKRRPSEYVREHFWFTTQPIEEPDDPQYLADIIEWVGWDRLMFSTDYPHWTSTIHSTCSGSRCRTRIKRWCSGTTPWRCMAYSETPGRRQGGRHRARDLQDRERAGA